MRLNGATLQTPSPYGVRDRGWYLNKVRKRRQRHRLLLDVARALTIHAMFLEFAMLLTSHTLSPYHVRRMSPSLPANFANSQPSSVLSLCVCVMWHFQMNRSPIKIFGPIEVADVRCGYFGEKNNAIGDQLLQDGPHHRWLI